MTEPSGSLLPAVAAGLVAAIVGGVVWGLIVKITDYEVGIVAWGIGFVAGTAVVFATRGGKGPAPAGDRRRLRARRHPARQVPQLRVRRPGAGERSWDSASGSSPSDMFRFFRENLDDVFGLFDLLWVGLAVFTAWRVPQTGSPSRLRHQPSS